MSRAVPPQILRCALQVLAHHVHSLQVPGTSHCSQWLGMSIVDDGQVVNFCVAAAIGPSADALSAAITELTNGAEWGVDPRSPAPSPMSNGGDG